MLLPLIYPFLKRKNHNYSWELSRVHTLKEKSKQAALNILHIACKAIKNISVTWKTKLLLIRTFLTAAKPRLGSRFAKSKLVPHQALLTTTHETMSSTCYAISHIFGMHHMLEVVYLWSGTALFFFCHTQTHFCPLFHLLFVKRHYNPHTTAFCAARILTAYKRQLVF